jgi:hypothetical protein
MGVKPSNAVIGDGMLYGFHIFEVNQIASMLGFWIERASFRACCKSFMLPGSIGYGYRSSFSIA